MATSKQQSPPSNAPDAQPPPRRAPGQSGRINEAPPAQGPGADNVRGVQARLRELPPTIATYRPTIPAVAGAQVNCIALIGQLARMQLNLVAQVQRLDAQNRRNSGGLAMEAAREALQGGQFATVMDRRRAEEEKANSLLAQASTELANQAAAERSDEAAALVNKTRDGLLAARKAIERAEFERDVDVTAESDAEFLRKVEALRTKCAALPVFRRGPFAQELYDRALDLGDEDRQRLIEAALLPIATEQVLDGAAKLRAADSRAGRAGDATKALNAATLFVNKAGAQQRARAGADLLAGARVVQGQLEMCFLRTGGLDAADPASLSGAEFATWMRGGRTPASLTADLPVDPQWLTRPLRSKAPRALPPYPGGSAEIAVRTGKAASQ
jgi:hypothetical protein